MIVTDKATQLLVRFLEQPQFRALSTENHATLDLLETKSPAQKLRAQADAIEARDALIKETRAYLSGAL